MHVVELVVAIPEFRKFCVNFVNLPLESWCNHFAAMQAVDQAVRLFLGARNTMVPATSMFECCFLS